MKGGTRMRRLSLLLVSLTFLAVPSYAEIRLTLDAQKGLVLGADDMRPYGYLTSLKISGVALPADLRAGNATVVGVLQSFHWLGSATSPLEFTLVVSTLNKQRLMMRQNQKPPVIGSAVEFSFGTFEYDPLQKVWFPSLAQASGVAALQGVITLFSIDTTGPFTDVQSPQTWRVTIAMVPPAGVSRQTILYATGAGKFVQFPWGPAAP
jgi:hypothetical protein